MFRIDASAVRYEAIPGPDTGDVDNVHDRPDGGWLIGAGNGLFQIDAAASRSVHIPGPRTGEIKEIYALPAGGWLVVARRGLFRIDSAASRYEAIPGHNTGDVDRVRALSEGGWVVRAEGGVFFIDAAASRYEVLSSDPNSFSVPIVRFLSDGRWLVGTRRGLFLFDDATNRNVAIPGPSIRSVEKIHERSDGGWLVGSRGLFRIDAMASRYEAIPGPDTSWVTEIRDLSGGGWLVGAQHGLFRIDAAASRYEAIPGPDTGRVTEIHERSDKGWLVRSESGLFRVDPAASRYEAIPGPDTGEVEDIHALSDGGWLVEAKRNLFRLDAATSQIVAIPSSTLDSLSSIYNIHHMTNGNLLVNTSEGNLLALASFSGASVKLEKTAPVEAGEFKQGAIADLVLRHWCARVAGSLGLVVVAQHAEEIDSKTDLRVPARDVQPGDGKASFLARFDSLAAGEWQLQLVATASGSDVPVGAPVSFQVDEPTGDWLQRRWPWLTAAGGGLYIGTFAALFFLAHWYTAASRIISDPNWARVGVWPFFLLRHWPPAQRWVLEPWFQAVRRATKVDVPFFDPPVSAADGQQSSGEVLLSRLCSTRRLWLHGRGGMGKSAVFAAWERTYFAASDAQTLGSAARRYGFILITLTVRHYADLPPLASHRPETWVIEAVRRRLEEFGFDTNDHGLIGAMLKAGYIALGLDGANEADRDDALEAFARQFPQVPLLITSQAIPASEKDWQVWHLPGNVDELRDGLLKTWLGAEKGAVLSNRVVTKGLSESIVSGYDLRLLADLAGSDPEYAPLPADRTELYRTILSHIIAADGQPLRLEELKHLAWSMVTERRRRIESKDLQRLGSETIQALAKDGVRIIRQVGAEFEFRHDQMRAFLAALWLVEEVPTVRMMEQVMIDAGAFALSRRDQEELWRFLAMLLGSALDFEAFWRFSNGEPEARVILLAALQAEASKRDMTLVLSPQVAHTVNIGA